MIGQENDLCSPPYTQLLTDPSMRSQLMQLQATTKNRSTISAMINHPQENQLIPAQGGHKTNIPSSSLAFVCGEVLSLRLVKNRAIYKVHRRGMSLEPSNQNSRTGISLFQLLPPMLEGKQAALNVLNACLKDGQRACCMNSLKGAFVSIGNRAAVALWIKHIRIYFYASEVNSCLLHYTNTERKTLSGRPEQHERQAAEESLAQAAPGGAPHALPFLPFLPFSASTLVFTNRIIFIVN
ncbi:hypothetical protein EK904_003483 [Melospiza melodia maxima]|nr:hypothetical protein EK904_003483 [Melospiza melodia maxima]